MKDEIARQLIDLNHQFYQSFAGDFSETRSRLQLGVLKVLERIPAQCSLLDLGCGNGQVARQLALSGFRGTYLGADFSLGLLERAESGLPSGFQADFKELDLTAPDWKAVLPSAPFDIILCFATLHHIPSQALRARLCRNMRNHLPNGGKLYLSVWQFLRSKRLKGRILPWETAGLQEDQVDEGDYLLDWRRGGEGIRYVHHYSLAELEELAGSSGFKVLETFDSDGERGRLGLYQVWEGL